MYVANFLRRGAAGGMDLVTEDGRWEDGSRGGGGGRTLRTLFSFHCHSSLLRHRALMKSWFGFPFSNLGGFGFCDSFYTWSQLLNSLLKESVLNCFLNWQIRQTSSSTSYSFSSRWNDLESDTAFFYTVHAERGEVYFSRPETRNSSNLNVWHSLWRSSVGYPFLCMQEKGNTACGLLMKWKFIFQK